MRKLVSIISEAKGCFALVYIVYVLNLANILYTMYLGKEVLTNIKALINASVTAIVVAIGSYYYIVLFLYNMRKKEDSQ